MMRRALFLVACVLLVTSSMVVGDEFTDEAVAAGDAFDEVNQQLQSVLGQTPEQFRRLKSRIQAQHQAQEEEHQYTPEEEDQLMLNEIAAQASARAAQQFTPTDGPHKRGPSKRGGAPLPVSIFGVPSVTDEECAMCIYFVQRIQNGVADRLDNGPGAPPADPAPGQTGAAGLPGATAAAQQAIKVRNSNSKLQKKPGGRGIVRVIAEDLTQAICAVDRMPVLFNPYCSAFVEPNAINAIRKGIFFNLPTTEVCQQAQLCRDDSYINTNAGPHSAKTSMFLNGQRGICGMLGGARDRPTSREGKLINAVCHAHGAIFGQDSK